MSYISDIFKRANIQQIREFLVSGTELLKISDKSYQQRIDEGMENAIRMIHTQFPENSEQMENSLLSAVSACEDVYMEIGLQAGIMLAAQILGLSA